MNKALSIGSASLRHNGGTLNRRNDREAKAVKRAILTLGITPRRRRACLRGRVCEISQKTNFGLAYAWSKLRTQRAKKWHRQMSV